MPRRREVPKREVLPDPKFGNQDLSKFVNVLMTAGKKSVAERILYGALEQVAKKSGKDPIEVFNQAISNAKPQVEVKSRRVGGANYQVPVEVRPSRRMALAMRWLKEFAQAPATLVFDDFVRVYFSCRPPADENGPTSRSLPPSMPSLQASIPSGRSSLPGIARARST